MRLSCSRMVKALIFVVLGVAFMNFYMILSYRDLHGDHYLGEIHTGSQSYVEKPAQRDSRPCPVEHGCWEIRNQRIRAVFVERPVPHWHLFEDQLPGSAAAWLPVQGAPLFELHGKKIPFQEAQVVSAGRDCQVQKVTQVSPRDIVFSLSCQSGITAEFSAELTTDSAHYLRFRVRIWTTGDGAGWPETGFKVLRLVNLNRKVHVEETRTSQQRPIDGLPVVVSSRFFVGVEHPMSEMVAAQGTPNPEAWSGLVGQLSHLGNLPRPTKDQPWEFGAVFGAFAEVSQARRSFVTYLHAERPGRRTPMVHYNSWYDFYSYQDEGFNGGFNDVEKNDELINSLRPDVLSEENCSARVEAFGRELVVKRNATIDSFLWDDGWDNPKTLWEFDTERFPRRFDVVATKALQYGAGTGVWLSPWGGYGFPQENRIEYGRKYGFETNINKFTESEGFSLAGKIYRSEFFKVALKFRREQGVNMFKFDGVAGDPVELAAEMEAMLSLISDLREPVTARAGERRGLLTEETAAAPVEGIEGDVGAGAVEASAAAVDSVASSSIARARAKAKQKKKKDKDAVWINLTTGTWASPFFLFWADTIWRGGPDIASRRRDWLPDPVPDPAHGHKYVIRPDGLSKRQRWIRWRNLILYMLVVERSTFFPLSQMMIHGVVLASHGDALHWGLNEFDAIDFAQEVWSFVALGLQLQELYIAPRYMTSYAWDILAEGLQWARREADILRDSHWAFGDPSERQVYAVASWDVAMARGFIFLHNPTGVGQVSEEFSAELTLELPHAQLTAPLEVSVVKSIFRHEHFTDESGDRKRLRGWPCNQLPLVQDHGSCKLMPTIKVSIRLLPSEVLVLAVRQAVQDKTANPTIASS
eukprot:TRINITY_DN23625_c0_g1_i1.p1 TRINITY_DN23625_c0_g1~~TRINITY_DN23625_c0_g1_i1.p1  ORF type:complete len:870 (-),score=114.77 TRINITY_DN23625_c0_g1_i1:65-2674(-)